MGQAGPLDPNEADRLMSYVLDHYIKHYDAVLRKLGHARKATGKSITELGKADTRGSLRDLSEIKAYDEMWKKVIDLFTQSGMSEEELVKVDGVLGNMPHIIRKYYDVLVRQDEVLQELIARLESEEYQEAIARTRTVQSRPDLMSGLHPQEFEAQEVHKHARMFRLPSRPH